MPGVISTIDSAIFLPFSENAVNAKVAVPTIAGIVPTVSTNFPTIPIELLSRVIPFPTTLLSIKFIHIPAIFSFKAFIFPDKELIYDSCSFAALPAELVNV